MPIGKAGDIEIPEEHDTGIFTQGVNAKESGQPDDNPFSPEFPHQHGSWAAGYAAGVAPESEAPPEPLSRSTRRAQSSE